MALLNPPDTARLSTLDTESCNKASTPEPASNTGSDIRAEEQTEESTLDIRTLIHVIRSRQDSKFALELAYRSVEGLPAAPSPAGEAGVAAQDELQDVQTLLDEQSPRCARMLRVMRECHNLQNKTPVAVLHEYASKCHRDVLYTVLTTSTVGPFEMEAKLTSLDRRHVFVCAVRKGRTKKNAKQLAAAGVIETLLERLSVDMLLRPGIVTRNRQPRGAHGVRPQPPRPYARGHYMSNPPWLSQPYQASPSSATHLEVVKTRSTSPMLSEPPGLPRGRSGSTQQGVTAYNAQRVDALPSVLSQTLPMVSTALAGVPEGLVAVSAGVVGVSAGMYPEHCGQIYGPGSSATPSWPNAVTNPLTHDPRMQAPFLDALEQDHVDPQLLGALQQLQQRHAHQQLQDLEQRFAQQHLPVQQLSGSSSEALAGMQGLYLQHTLH